MMESMTFVLFGATGDLAKSKACQKLNINIDSLSLRELYTIIEENPGLLRKPLILDEKKITSRVNEEELRCFLPRKMRVFQLDEVHSFIEEAL
ncbi:ArsC/Spx/MgsR family protein [Neobacillus drentensis]|uniref:ArsC/Spx/MgsR family protein n=1 Tax=Neobacillus drentensis TaxID=220684 RepID=UPI003B587778